MLYIRMSLYAVFAALASAGLVDYNPDAGTVTFQVESLALGLSGAVGFVGTFWTSRIAKKRGGKT